MNIQSVISNNLQVSPNLKNTLSNTTQKKFDFNLDKTEIKELDTKETLELMLEDIQELKDKIDFDLTVENVMKYKKIIKSFLQFYVENALEVRDVYAQSQNNKTEKLTIVKKVQEDIEELDDALSLLDTRSGHLDMLRRIGEINGMIIDLKM